MGPRTGGAGRWLRRAAMAVLAGLVVGVGGGVFGIRVLIGDAPLAAARVVEPEPDPTLAPRRQIRGPRADGSREGSPSRLDRDAGAEGDGVAVVPDLVGRVEGDARRLLARAGFDVGTIMFREDDLPVGTVLQTFPVPGERVPLPAAVNLILADRRRVADTLAIAPPDTVAAGAPDTLAPPATFADSAARSPDTLVTLRLLPP
jgi:hypothetical protein